MPWARASSLERALWCPATARFPQADRGQWWPGYLSDGTVQIGLPPPEDRDSSAAEWGTAMHAAKAGVGQDPWNLWMDPHRERLWPSRLGKHEVTVGYDCETGMVERFMSSDEDARTAWKMRTPASYVVGTCDWWGQLPSGEPWVDDLKTGWRRPEVVTPQTLFYLMCRLKYEPDWKMGRVSITWAPRRALKDDEEPPAPTREGLWRQVTQTVLDGFEYDLRAAWEHAKRGDPARPGAHCLYCPSAQVCDVASR